MRTSRRCRRVTSVKHDDGEVLLYTARRRGRRSAALLALTECARRWSRRTWAIRRATLEDVFLDLTGRALRD